MGHVPALQRYLSAEIEQRGWSVEQFAARAQLSLSNAYLIVRDGKDNVRQNTFDNIAAAFGMTPAELASVIGKGAPEEHPQRITVQALLRDVPDDDLSTVERIVRTFTRVRPSPDHAAKPRRGRPNTHSNRPTSDDDDALARCYNPVSQVLMRSVSAA